MSMVWSDVRNSFLVKQNHNFPNLSFTGTLLSFLFSKIDMTKRALYQVRVTTPLFRVMPFMTLILFSTQFTVHAILRSA